MSEYILEMLDITKEFPGVKALDKVQLKVRPGTIHALMGENGAGKSTLMKCLIGIYHKTAGTIIFDGKEVDFNTTLEGLNSGISMIQQELSPVMERSVAENVWTGRQPMKNKLMVDHKKMREDTVKLFEQLQVDINPDQKMKELTVSQMQMVEIVKAVSYNSKIVIMDEPTSSLTKREVDHLFRIIRQLKSEGVAVIYISHKMDEIFEICDEVTVYRDGHFIATSNVSDITMDDLIKQMVGREVTDMFPKIDCEIGETILKVDKINAGKLVKNVSFELHKGEILGFAGLVGAGRSETMEAIFGLRHITSGTVTLKGKQVNIKSPVEAISLGISFLTEDRRGKGIVGIRDISDNTILSNLRKYGTPLNHRAIKKDVDQYVGMLRVKTPSNQELIRNLSGGNQQKVLVARCLLTDPDIIIVDEPTRGIDVGAKAEIHSLITNLAGQGKAIIMISSEMPEVMGMSDRMVVMHEGEVTGILNRSEFDQEMIMKMAAGANQ
ncbi:MAG: sugar ABC transporter ATP-binding protein [Oscillospiraceae bacterium]|nr:sugar ABC transporter ATP-binding protein [Oscillospiraceae bacterium]